MIRALLLRVRCRRRRRATAPTWTSIKDFRVRVRVVTHRPVFVCVKVCIRDLTDRPVFLGDELTFVRSEHDLEWQIPVDGTIAALRTSVVPARSWCQRLGDALVDEALYWWNATDRVRGWYPPPRSHELTSFCPLPYVET